MDLSLSGTTALVTGASRGIGLAVVRALTAEGVRVAAVSRTTTPELAATGAASVTADLATADGPARAVAEAVDALGGELDLLVNNAGGGDGGQGRAGGFLGTTDAQWLQYLDLNLLAAVRTTRAALPALLRRRGTLLNISSNSARMPSAGPIPYTTAKAGLTAFGKALAEEFGPQGLRVNTLSPGPVRTSLWEGPDSYGAELARSMGITQEQLIAGMPSATGMVTGRLVEPEEVAAAVTFFASPRTASLTGADLLLDGGATKAA